jgi:hypothetical protein
MLGENVLGIFRSLRLVVKTQLEPSAMASTIHKEGRAIDPALLLAGIGIAGVLAQRIATCNGPRRSTRSASL